MMDCLEFRRAKLAEPRATPAGALEHCAGCSRCAAFSREVDDAERRLDDALRVAVPDGLPERVIYRSRGWRLGHRAWALAAGIVLALALGLALWNVRTGTSDEYARHAIEHVVMEPESFSTLRNADSSSFEAALQAFGARLSEPPGKIRYVRLCPFDGVLGWHIVFDSPEGQATLLLVPGRRPKRYEVAAAGQWSALVRPVRTGYYAVVTASAELTRKLDEQLRERVDWIRG